MASPWRAFVDIELPHMLPGVVGAALFGFLLSFNELSRSILLRGGSTTLPLYEWAQASAHTSNVPLVFALSTRNSRLQLRYHFGLVLACLRTRGSMNREKNLRSGSRRPRPRSRRRTSMRGPIDLPAVLHGIDLESCRQGCDRNRREPGNWAKASPLHWWLEARASLSRICRTGRARTAPGELSKPLNSGRHSQRSGNSCCQIRRRLRVGNRRVPLAFLAYRYPGQ